MTSNIRQKSALAAGIKFPIITTVATATILGWSNPAQAASFDLIKNQTI